MNDLKISQWKAVIEGMLLREAVLVTTRTEGWQLKCKEAQDIRRIAESEIRVSQMFNEETQSGAGEVRE